MSNVTFVAEWMNTVNTVDQRKGYLWKLQLQVGISFSTDISLTFESMIIIVRTVIISNYTAGRVVQLVRKLSMIWSKILTFMAARDFLHSTPNQTGSPPSLLYNGYHGSFLEFEQIGCFVAPSSSSAKVLTGKMCRSTPYL